MVSRVATGQYEWKPEQAQKPSQDSDQILGGSRHGRVRVCVLKNVIAPLSPEIFGAAAILHGFQFWAWSSCASTVEPVRQILQAYILTQDDQEKRQDRPLLRSLSAPCYLRRALRAAFHQIACLAWVG